MHASINFLIDSHAPDFSHLLPFGVGTDDLQGPRGDDSASEPLTLRVPFTFFGTEYKEIIVRIYQFNIITSYVATCHKYFTVVALHYTCR